MPLRDHFRPPLDDITSWEGFHGQWPAMIVAALNRQLPPRDYPGKEVGRAFQPEMPGESGWKARPP